MDKEKDWAPFVKAVATIDKVTAGKERSKEEMAIMYNLLKGYELKDILEALHHHARHEIFHVKPANIVKFIEGDKSEKSLVAWHYFLKGYLRYGYYSSVRFPDPAYHYATEMLGGWIAVGEGWHHLTDKEMEFKGKEWRRLYEAGLSRASWDGANNSHKVQPYLVGFHEAYNRSGKFDEFIPPVYDGITGESLGRLSRGGGEDLVAIAEKGTMGEGDGAGGEGYQGVYPGIEGGGGEAVSISDVIKRARV